MTRRYTFCRRMAIFFLILIINEILTPSLALALTSGPTQPEMHGFEAVSTSNMVDLFTGDFNYNIPLLDAGGYPINISYHAGSSGDDESSWVGLGWSLTPGVMNRDMRGLPDDFKGDAIKKEFNIKPDETIGFNAGLKFQLMGIYLNKAKSKKGIVPSIGVNVGGFYNNYRGFGLEYGVSPSVSLGELTKNTDTKAANTLIPAKTTQLTAGANLKYNSQSGIDADLTVGVGGLGLAKTNQKRSFGANVSVGFNTRQGLKDLTFGAGGNINKTDASGNTTRYSGTAGASLSFANRTYVPTNPMPLVNQSSTFHGTIGLALWGLHPDLQLTGYKSRQDLASRIQYQPAYGYLNSQVAANDNQALMDYNKEKPIAYRASQPNLPLSVGTYDLFSATGQGIGGQFRAMRNDVGMLKTPQHTNQSQSVNLGLELGFAANAHAGFEARQTDVSNTAGNWDSDSRGAADKLAFTRQTGEAGSADYEPVFIKDASESIAKDATNTTEFTPKIGNNTPIALQLDKKNGKGVFATDVLRKEQRAGAIKATLDPLSEVVKREKREKRNQVFSYLTANEATIFGLDKDIKTNPINDNCVKDDKTEELATSLSRTTYSKHHISEVSVTQGDGARYVYGIPAYNVLQEEATFAVSSSNRQAGALITYNTVGDASGKIDNVVTNQVGRDNYYESQTLPPYAHSYLLTGILSADYVDVTNNGITDDDLGTAVKLNYTKAYKDFGWRTPYQAKQARHNEGYRSDPLDDKASYVYGQKEIWYTHSIETRTMVAKFILEDRFDALGVSDRDGTQDTQKRLKCLKRIELYSKSDLLRGVSIPIKTVHFDYDYSLCKGVPNTTDAQKYGKLTLRSIYFTYGKNESGKLNAYKFRYNGDTNATEQVEGCQGTIEQVVNNTSDNMPYDIDNYDRWGAYKKATDNPNNVANKYYPYATQNKEHADKYAKAWNMTAVELPSGGVINIDYESDDYAYVQDKRAGQMCSIKGFSEKNTDAAKYQLYEKGNAYKYMHVDISASPVTNLQDFKQRYLQDVNKLYFNCGVRLQEPGTYTAAENIKGYVDIDGIENITFSADKKTAIIPLSLASSGSWGRAINPICKIALQTLRLELPFLAYPNYETTGSSFKQFLGKLFGVFPDMVRLIKGFDKYALDKSWVQAIELSNSWVRLANPNYKKLGGGSRVKEIRMSNYWSSNAASPNAAEYGQRYTYTTENPTDRTQQISSGVAAYEPIIGNEENLFREPVTYEDKIKMAPNNEYYMEKPFGESLFPAPTVGYGSVKVQNLVKVGNNLMTEAEAGLKRTGMGYTVSEFYTAKDFPTVVDFTTKQHVDYQPNTGATFLDFFKIIKKHHTGVSQGYTIEVNDMHGKPKAEYIKNAYGADISWTKYDYRTETDGSKKLKNDGLDLINTEGSLSKGSIGYDFDIWNDMQQDKTITNAPGMSVNSESFFIGFIPIFLVPFFPSICRDESVFRSAVTTKFIKRFGILEKVTKMENGASVSTENLAFDAETGQSLLTRTQNEFKDNVYQFSYPAHWAYENGMGMAYKNIGLYAKDVVIEENGVIPSAFSDYFVSGDELQVTPDRGGATLLNRFHVIQYAETDLSKHIIDPFGEYLPAGAYSLKVLRSGRRNQATASIGSVVSRKDPRQGGKLVFDGQILAAQAVTFKDEWAMRSGRASTCVVNARDIDVNDKVFQLLITALGDRDAKSDLGRTIGAIIDNDRAQFLDFGQAGGISYQELSAPSDDGTFTRYEALINGTCLLVIEPDNDEHRGSSFSFNSPIFQDGFLQCLSNEYKYINMRITLTCKDCKEQCYALLKEGDLVNPYQLGIKGNWRPEASHALYSQRTGPLSITTKNLRTDGDVVDYENFWVLSPADETTPSTFKPASNLTKWVKANTMTQYDEKGNDVENVDALNIYSSTLFRYKNTLAAAVAANARLREIAFDGFEDYGYNYNYVEDTKDAPTADCGTNHFDFAVVDGTVKTASISRKKAHTGNYSFVLPPKSGGCKKTIPVIAPNGLNDDPNVVVLQTADKRLVNRLLQPFSLTQNRDFLFSAWVSKDGGCSSEDLGNIAMYLSFKTSRGETIGSKIECTPSGTIVDGWQRIEKVLQTPENAASLVIEWENNVGTNVYMDDLRIFPADGKMKSFVYDARTLRLMAQLDENNYATFYEYDDEGTLVRTKRETERGIVTIQENRSTLRRPK